VRSVLGRASGTEIADDSPDRSAPRCLAWTSRDSRRAIAPRPRCTFVRVGRDYRTRFKGLMGEERGTWRNDVTLAAGPMFHLR
jgi:hypothetical protein